MDDLMCKVQIRHKEKQFSLNTEHVMKKKKINLESQNYVQFEVLLSRNEKKNIWYNGLTIADW